MRLILTLFLGFGVLALDAGHCMTDYSTKHYIQNDFSAPYPKKVVYSCVYTCLDLDNQSTTIRGTSQVIVRSLADDAYKVVCQGVKVKKTSWGYDYDKTLSFYAHQTSIREIKEWARNHIQRYNPISEKLLVEFKEKILVVANSYEQAGTSNTQYASDFANAALVLQEMAHELPEDKTLFDKYLWILETLNGNTGSDFTAQKLILDQVLYGAPWAL